LLDYYGEDGDTTTPQLYLGTLCAFVDKLMAAHYDNESEAKEKQRQQQREQREQEKLALKKRTPTPKVVKKMGMSIGMRDAMQSRRSQLHGATAFGSGSGSDDDESGAADGGNFFDQTENLLFSQDGLNQGLLGTVIDDDWTTE
jgi:hypothetical protein